MYISIVYFDQLKMNAMNNYQNDKIEHLNILYNDILLMRYNICGFDIKNHFLYINLVMNINIKINPVYISSFLFLFFDFEIK